MESRFLALLEEGGASRAGRILLAGARIARVNVRRSRREWVIHLEGSAPAGEAGAAAIGQVEAGLRRAVPGLESVKLLFTPTGGCPDPEGVLAGRWPAVVSAVTEALPIASGWLGRAAWHWEHEEGNDGRAVLVVELPDAMGQELLGKRGVREAVAAAVEREVGIRALVRLTVNPALNGEEIDAELTREEEQRITELLNGDGRSPRSVAVLRGRAIGEAPEALDGVHDERARVVVEGEAFNIERQKLRGGGTLLTFDLTDYTNSITVKVFERKDQDGLPGLEAGSWVRVRGAAVQDKYAGELTLNAEDIVQMERPGRMDGAEEKRVELHLHTKMSAMDAVTDIGAAFAQAARWGHDALAVTDHGVLQAYPEACEAADRHGLKVIYGVEAYLVDDEEPIVVDPRAVPVAEEEYVVFDLETTGLSPLRDEIVEIGAVRISGGKVTDRFHSLVRPDRPLSAEVANLTGIDPRELAAAPRLEEALPGFVSFCGEACLVAHNAGFDTSFLQLAAEAHLGRRLANPVLDTLGLARALCPGLARYTLDSVAAALEVNLARHHRALQDAEAAAGVLLVLLDRAAGRLAGPGAHGPGLADLNRLVSDISHEHLRSYHALILVRNQSGLKALYRLVSAAHLDFFYRHPRIRKSDLARCREGLLVGSGCESGELYQALLQGASPDRLERIASFYDFLELQPLDNNEFLVRQGRVPSSQTLIELNRRVYALGKKIGRPVVATGDVHFLEPRDEVYRRILLAGQGYADADVQAPLYLRTTDEMLREFEYLGRAAALEIVVTNTREIAGRIEAIKPMPDGTHAPAMPGAEDEVTARCRKRAAELYGDPLPPLIADRLERELAAVNGNGFAGIYLLAQKLVTRSLDDGYLVGSRGSVGSSLVATLCGITEVNPLPPHYRCPGCRYTEFASPGTAGSGYDLPDRGCPVCGLPLQKDGQNIPFETFLGFEGDKVPDIDLNFSGEYQSTVHRYTEDLLGRKNVYRAGTIATIADRTAFGFVHAYARERGLELRNAEVNRLVRGITGVKRTTGQHPGGLMVVPEELDVNDFTPVQYPADDRKSGTITTHFDYHSISSRLLKLDILGHDDPTVLRMLGTLTGVDVRSIPFDDPETLALFRGLDSLGVTPEQIGTDVGTLGIPEFGTRFVRQMLADTRPRTFADLVRISGLSHGTDVWLNNAQDLVRSGTADLSQVICTRDDIMVALIEKGLPSKAAFKIMESVRKGKGVNREDEELMRAHGVPEWYIESCKKIKYMFPKAHAGAYVMMAFRIAYFKVHYPTEFYAAYFSVRAEEFDATLVPGGAAAIGARLAELEKKGNETTARERNLLVILEVAREMYARGLAFVPIDLETSCAMHFRVTPDGLLPPFASLPGLGETAARNIVAAREEAPFTSVDDLRIRARLSRTVIDLLGAQGCLRGLPETNQLVLF